MVTLDVLRTRGALPGLGALGFSVALGLAVVATANTIVAGGE